MNVLSRKSFLLGLCLPLAIAQVLTGCANQGGTNLSDQSGSAATAAETAQGIIIPVRQRPVSKLPSRVLTHKVRVGVDPYFDAGRNFRHFGGYLQLGSILAVELAVENTADADLEMKSTEIRLLLDDGTSLAPMAPDQVMAELQPNLDAAGSQAATFFLTAPLIGVGGAAIASMAQAISEEVRRAKLSAELNRVSLRDSALEPGSSSHGVAFFQVPIGFAPSRTTTLQMTLTDPQGEETQTIGALLVSLETAAERSIQEEIENRKGQLSYEIAKHLVRTRSDLAMSQYRLVINDYSIQNIEGDDAEVLFKIELQARGFGEPREITETLSIRSLAGHLWILEGERLGVSEQSREKAARAEVAATAYRAQKDEIERLYRFVSENKPRVNAELSRALTDKGRLNPGSTASMSAFQVLDTVGGTYDVRVEYWKDPQPGQSATSSADRSMADFSVSLDAASLDLLEPRRERSDSSQFQDWEFLILSRNTNTRAEFDDHLVQHESELKALLLEQVQNTRDGFDASEYYVDLRRYRTVEAWGDTGRIEVEAELAKLRGSDAAFQGTSFRVEEVLNTRLLDENLSIVPGGQGSFDRIAFRPSNRGKIEDYGAVTEASSGSAPQAEAAAVPESADVRQFRNHIEKNKEQVTARLIRYLDENRGNFTASRFRVLLAGFEVIRAEGEAAEVEFDLELTPKQQHGALNTQTRKERLDVRITDDGLSFVGS